MKANSSKNVRALYLINKFISSCIFLLILFINIPLNGQEVIKASNLLDLSGLAWIEDDLFLGIHDAKDNQEKHNWPRVSLLQLPKSELDGVKWKPFDLEFPGPKDRSSDLESASSIPGGNDFLVVESGQEGKGDRCIFHVIYRDGNLSVNSFTNWPVEINNVEATEVHKIGDKLIFLYAERADSMPSTKLRWAIFSLDPLNFKTFDEVTYNGIDPVGKGSRPIVALDLDDDGFIYIVSAYDSGSDDGPFRSVVWKIGKLLIDENGKPTVSIDDQERIADLDGLKVESIAIRRMPDGQNQIYIGTDDEHYGGIIRLIPDAN